MQEYTEKTFCIDLISDFYKTSNPFKIIEKAKEDLDIILQPSEVMDYLGYEEDWEKESRYVQMKDIFN